MDSRALAYQCCASSCLARSMTRSWRNWLPARSLVLRLAFTDPTPCQELAGPFLPTILPPPAVTLCPLCTAAAILIPLPTLLREVSAGGCYVRIRSEICLLSGACLDEGWAGARVRLDLAHRLCLTQRLPLASSVSPQVVGLTLPGVAGSC